MTTFTTPSPFDTGPDLGGSVQQQLRAVGSALCRSLNAVVEAVPGAPSGPAQLSRALRIDKVLASRVLKAVRHADPISVIYLAPGPDPLRRVLRNAQRIGVPSEVVQAAQQAVDAFDHLIRSAAGDRSSLDAIVSAWLPEARQEFELRRKQSIYKATSQLKGAVARTTLATVLLHPSDDGAKLDVVWLNGMLGLHRLRPGVAVKISTRRLTGEENPRHPRSLRGEPVEHLSAARLDEFCSTPPPSLDIHAAGTAVHYLLADNGFGPGSAVDIVFAEVNLAEMPRYVADPNRRGHVFAEISTPCRTLHFDVLVHDDVYPGRDPSLLIYDTALEGVADINDRSRDIDRLEMSESIQHLGRGMDRFRASDVPRYTAMLETTCSALGWNDAEFRGYRCRVDYPIYGTQVAMAFTPPTQ